MTSGVFRVAELREYRASPRPGWEQENLVDVRLEGDETARQQSPNGVPTVTVEIKGLRRWQVQPTDSELKAMLGEIGRRVRLELLPA